MKPLACVACDGASSGASGALKSPIGCLSLSRFGRLRKRPEGRAPPANSTTIPRSELTAGSEAHHSPGISARLRSHFSFAQLLTESAKLAKHCMLVVSLPASDTAGSPHTQADDVEVGGERGRAALDRLRNVIGRVETSWRPASAEESFEIVRRRLFEPLVEKAQYVARDTVAKAFFDLYATQGAEFPPECRNSDYEIEHS